MQLELVGLLFIDTSLKDDFLILMIAINEMYNPWHVFGIKNVILVIQI